MVAFRQGSCELRFVAHVAVQASSAEFVAEVVGRVAWPHGLCPSGTLSPW